MDDMCEDHSTKFMGRKHPDGKNKGDRTNPDHMRGVGHPAMHTKGKLPSQLNPDHGMHKGAGKHM